MKNKIVSIVVIISFIIILLDQTSKFLVTKYVSSTLGNGLIKLEIAENTGMAFGFNDGNTKNIVLTIFVLILIISFIKNQKEQLDNKTIIAISLVLGGGVSNLIDRIFRGGVIDFIKICNFPNFNIADICICTAWVLLVIFLIIYTNKNNTFKNIDSVEKSNKKIENKDEK